MILVSVLRFMLCWCKNLRVGIVNVEYGVMVL